MSKFLKLPEVPEDEIGFVSMLSLSHVNDIYTKLIYYRFLLVFTFNSRIKVF